MAVASDRAAQVRSERVDVTRKAILDAARRLFAERGYARTPVRLLAREAGVAVRTVYLAFGSKQGVLSALVAALGEDAGELETRHQAEGVVDGRQLLALVARLYRNLYERGADVIDMLRQGASVEPELRAALRLGHGRSRASVEALCRRLEELGELRPGLDVDHAAGHALVLLSRDGYEELVELRHWMHDDYEAWLARALQDALLEDRPG
jgi:AcrR family transcriptional regulator